MGKKKKVNPRKIPMSNEERISHELDRCTTLVYVIFLSVLSDKIGLSNDDMIRTYNGCIDLSDSISKGYVNVENLRNVLKEEYDIDIGKLK